MRRILIRRRIQSATSYGVVVFLCVWGLCGCAASTTTGVKTELNPTALSQIKTLGVQVIVMEEFTVVLQQEGMLDAGFLAGGVIGTAIQSGMQKGADSSTTQKLQPMLSGLNCHNILSSRIVDGLQRSGRFNTISDLSTPPATTSTIDGVLVLTQN